MSYNRSGWAATANHLSTFVTRNTRNLGSLCFYRNQISQCAIKYNTLTHQHTLRAMEEKELRLHFHEVTVNMKVSDLFTAALWCWLWVWLRRGDSGTGNPESSLTEWSRWRAHGWVLSLSLSLSVSVSPPWKGCGWSAFFDKLPKQSSSSLWTLVMRISCFLLQRWPIKGS